MKHIISIVLFASIAANIYSQKSISFTDKKNEVNIGFFNAFELSNFSDLGLGYKRHFDNGAFRLGTGIGLSTHEDTGETSTLKSSYLNLSPRIGYEFHQNFQRFQVLYGGDFVVKIRRSTSERTYTDASQNLTEHRNLYSIGLRPNLGLKLYINKSISITTETYLDISYDKSSNEIKSNTGVEKRTSKGSSVNLGPLGVFSINFHF